MSSSTASDNETRGYESNDISVGITLETHFLGSSERLLVYATPPLISVAQQREQWSLGGLDWGLGGHVQERAFFAGISADIFHVLGG